MKKLFCVVVADAGYSVGLDSPIIFHIKGNNSTQVEDAVHELLEDEYGYSAEIVKGLDIFSFEVTDLDIIELNTLED
jgi:hypothetical protein